MKTIHLLIMFCIISATAYSQAWVWEKAINTSANDIATDPNSNIIVLSKNGNATQLSKFTKDGILIWNNLLGKLGTFTPSGSLVVDKTGNIYIFTDGFDSINHQFTGIRSPGITKFDAAGNFAWHVNYTTSCTSGTVKKLSLKVDADDNIYAGLFVDFLGALCATKSVTLGSTTKNPTHIAVTGGPNPSSPRYYSLASLTNAGAIRWFKVLSTSFQNTGMPGLKMQQDLALSGQTLFLTGTVHNHAIYLDEANSVSVSGVNMSPWLSAFNTTNGNPKWGLALKNLNNNNPDTSKPSINVNLQTGKLALTHNMGGRVVIVPGDTLNTYTFYPLVWENRAYYVIYDTLGNKIKSQKLNIVPNVSGSYETLLGNRGRFFFVKSIDSLLKVDTGYNQLWRLTLPPATEKIFISQYTSDILATYTRAGVVYLAKMADSAGVISGKTYADWDNNGVYTPGTDSLLSNILITTNTAASGISGNDSGKYYLYASPGAYTVNANFNHPYYQFLPATHNATIAQYSDTITGKDFRLRPLSAFTDVSTNISALNIARPGGTAYYTVTVKNYGPTPQTIDVGLKLPALSSYNNISGGSVTVNAPDSITISFGSINPFETRKATLNLNISTTATITDTLRFYPVAFPYVTDVIQANNNDTLIQPVRTSFDPNEKEVNHGAQPLADTGNALLYTIHFQNTGTDTAFYVRIADTLSSKLDLHTFNFIDASHPVTTDIDHNIINFTFNPIALADSNHNEPLSHGFVKFSIKPLLPFAVTDTIFNNSAIYFDYNVPVITNSAKSWFFSPAPLPVILQSFVADKKSSSVLLRFETASEADLNNFIIERSNDGIHFNTIGSVKAKGTVSNGSSYLFEDLSPVQGVNFYRLKMVDKDLKTSYSWILVVKFSNSDLQNISIFPNPANDNLYLSFRGITNPKTFTCTITDAGGKMLWTVNINTSMRDTYAINTSILPNGVYFVTASGNGIIYSEKLMVKH